MFEPIELSGVVIDNGEPIRNCEFCHQPIWWGLTSHNKRNPFDVVGGRRTPITHWSTCVERDAARARLKRGERGQTDQRHPRRNGEPSHR